jgi:integrase/recombinase XerD
LRSPIPLIERSEKSKIKALALLRNEYLKSLAVKGFSDNTLRVRDVYIRIFLRWCGEREIAFAREVTKRMLERYQEHLFSHRKIDGQPLSISSQYSRLSLLRLWFKWMKCQGYLSKDPAAEVELPRLAYRLPTVLTKEQVERVLQQPDVGSLLGIRDRAILEMLYSTGMRRTELLRLRLTDVDRGRGVATIRQGKGKRDRVVPVGERALVWLDKYLAQARSTIATKIDTGIVFLTSAGAAFTPNHLSWAVRRYVRAANIGKNGACHLFRHTMATLMLEGGADTRYIQEMLGHARLDTTQIYTHVSVRMLKHVHSCTHPAARVWEQETKPPEILQGSVTAKYNQGNVDISECSSG